MSNEKLSNSDRLFKSIDKILGYSLPTKITYLNIELSVDKEPVITVRYIPDKICDPDHPLVMEQFNVAPIKKKRK